MWNRESGCAIRVLGTSAPQEYPKATRGNSRTGFWDSCVHPAWLAIAISYVIGLVVLTIGVAEYKVERWVRALIFG